MVWLILPVILASGNKFCQVSLRLTFLRAISSSATLMVGLSLKSNLQGFVKVQDQGIPRPLRPCMATCQDYGNKQQPFFTLKKSLHLHKLLIVILFGFRVIVCRHNLFTVFPDKRFQLVRPLFRRDSAQKSEHYRLIDFKEGILFADVRIHQHVYLLPYQQIDNGKVTSSRKMPCFTPSLKKFTVSSESWL